jgi:hypothetical protein
MPSDDRRARQVAGQRVKAAVVLECDPAEVETGRLEVLFDSAREQRVVQRGLGRQLAGIDCGQPFAERRQFLASRLLSLRSCIRQASQRFAITLAAGGNGIDAALKALVVRDRLLQRIFRWRLGRGARRKPDQVGARDDAK